ncbi:MAG: YidC/Oxa1 family membrane protein insertase [Acidimicrobiales bacterium]
MSAGVFVLAAGKSIFEPIYSALGQLLAWFYGLIPSYGVAIILLTIAVRLLVWPLTVKQVKSQQAMQRIQPEMKRLQAKHKGDRQKLNEEMMALYKEHGVNPFGGCLPLLLQFPLLLVMWRLIYGLVPKHNSQFELPKHIPKTSALYHHLAPGNPPKPLGKMVSWGIDLAQKALNVHGFGKALPFYALVAVVVATGYFQQRQINLRTNQPGAPVNQQAQMMGRIMPVMFGVFSLSFPAGVVVYFAVSNFWQIAQQALMFRSSEPPAPGADEDVRPVKPPKPKPLPSSGSRSGPSGRAGRAGRPDRQSRAARNGRNGKRRKAS